MSEKRLIDFDDLMRISFNSESSHDVAEEFDKLPTPTLTDVTGTRALDSMTEEEARELIEAVVSVKLVAIGLTFKTPKERHYFINWICEDNPSIIGAANISIHMGVVFKFGHPIESLKIVKWFLEKGFDIFEVGE